MSTPVKNLKARIVHAQSSLYKSLGSDLAEAKRRIEISGNPRLDDDLAIFNDVIAEMVRLDIDEFNKIIDSAAIKKAVSTITTASADLKKEAKRVKNIADDINKWRGRIDATASVVDKIVGLA